MRTVAALFVERGGAYFDLAGVDPWDRQRDARDYRGNYPVIAHPPCQAWGRCAEWGGYQKGDDDGCFSRALASVRRFGGVLEHPAVSRAFRFFGLNEPPKAGGWVNADFEGGWICQVDQGHYGHVAPKPTWLLAYGTDLPSLRWGASSAARRVTHLSAKQRIATPPAFRDLLLAMARSA